MDRNFQFLFYGLTLAWGIVVLYLIALSRRNRKIRQELERVKRMIDDRP